MNTNSIKAINLATNINRNPRSIVLDGGGKPDLPLFYSDFEYADAFEHDGTRLKYSDDFNHVPRCNALPITLNEIADASRCYPIVFSTGPGPIPLALVGLQEGVNAFLNKEGYFCDEAYVPAYVRRYPFLLVANGAHSEEFALAFDPTCTLINRQEGEPLFENGCASTTTESILNFCKQFEWDTSGPGHFGPLARYDLLVDSEMLVDLDGDRWTFGGFRMISERKLKSLSADVIAGMSRIGFLPMLYQHLQSLNNFKQLFTLHRKAGTLPKPEIRS